MAKSYQEYAETVKSSMSEIRTTLTELTEEDCSKVKLIDVNDKLSNLSIGNKLLINISADDYEGSTFTATHEDQETKATAKISNKSATITVPKAGTYTVSNNQDEQTKEATLIDSVDLDFIKFKATIKVTLASELVGETITCTLESEVLEQKATTTSLTFNIKKKGSWKVGVKNNGYITKTVNVQNAQEYTTSLTVDPASVPTITVRSKEEDNGKTIKCTKSGTVLQKVLKNRECVFILPSTGTWKITCDDYPEISKTVNVASAKAYRCALRASIFGVIITETESEPTTRVTYTDDADQMVPVKVTTSNGSVNYGEWKDTWIFEKFYPVMLKTNGTIGYRLNPDDQTKKEAGGTSDITSTSYDGNAMVCIEKFYTKFGMSGSNETIQISDEEEDGFEPIGFVRSDGSVADKIFVPMFMGSYDSSSKLRSISGQDIKYSVSFTDFRTAAQKNGSNYDIESYSMNEAISAVFAILMKTCNPKTALGDGRNYNSGKTGVLVSRGAIAYDTSTKATKFMWIEDFTSNYSSGMYRWETGILAQSSKLYVKMKPPYSGTSTSGYDEVTDAVLIQGQYLSKMKCSNKYGRYPITGNGSDSTYECSNWYTQTSSTLCVSLRAAASGVWGRGINHTASNTATHFGAALSYLPPA